MDILDRIIAKKLYGGGGGGGNTPSGGDDWFNDGNTHIWITLQEGRTSPMVGLAVSGTATVDWGDGSEPDTLTGTSLYTTVYTSNHEYGKEGDYIITLIVDGSAEITGDGSSDCYSSLLRYSATQDKLNNAYRMAIKRVEVGNGVTKIGSYSFSNCYAIESINLADCVKSIGASAFERCHNLQSLRIPVGENYIQMSEFSNCYALTSVAIPKSVISISDSAFINCYRMKYYDFTEHTAVPTLKAKNAFNNIPPDCEIRVPSSLVDEWKAATNWATYADNIVGV